MWQRLAECSGSQRSGADDQCAGDGVEQEVVAGREDDEQHEGGIEETSESHNPWTRLTRQTGSDDERIAEVHARHRGKRVVQAADESTVQAEVRARDGVGDPDARDPRRCRRVEGEDDERDQRCDEQRVAHQGIGIWSVAVEPEQVSAGDCEVKGQVQPTEQPEQAGDEWAALEIMLMKRWIDR